MSAKRFMYLSVGAFFLMAAVALGFHLGSQNAQAQSPDTTGFRYALYGGSEVYVWALPNGDIYRLGGSGKPFTSPPTFMGNFWAEDNYKKGGE